MPPRASAPSSKPSAAIILMMKGLDMAKLEGAMSVVEFLLKEGVVTNTSETYANLMTHIASLSDPAVAPVATGKVRKTRGPREKTAFEIKMAPLTRGLNAAVKTSLIKSLNGLASEAKTVYDFIVEHVPQISDESPLAPLKALEDFQLLDLAHFLWNEDKERDLEGILQDALALHQNNFVYPHVARPPVVEGGKKRTATKPSALQDIPTSAPASASASKTPPEPSIPLSDAEEASDGSESDASDTVSRSLGKPTTR